MAREQVPGASIAVAVDDRTWSWAFGVADLEHRVPVTPRTRFRVGSVSKSLTAGALGTLVADGTVDLDAPLTRYLPEYPLAAHRPTLRQLATHTAGIRHYVPASESASVHRYPSLADALPMFWADPPLFAPGTDAHYSSHAWNLVGVAMERASGRDFPALMQERLLGPLGLGATVIDDVAAVIPDRARFHHVDEGGRTVNAEYVDNSYKWPAGGYLSTPADLARYAQAVYRGELLGRAGWDSLLRTARLPDGTDTGFAVGWFDFVPRATLLVPRGRLRADDVAPAVRTLCDALGTRLVFHSGSAMGGEAHLLLSPEHRIAVAIAWNRDERQWRQFALAFEIWAELVAARAAGAPASPEVAGQCAAAERVFGPVSP